MKKQEFEPITKNWQTFPQRPKIGFQKSGGILRPTAGDDLSHVKSLQLSDFGKKKETQIELIKDGDVIKAIQFRCGCGCEATVELVVDATSSSNI